MRAVAKRQREREDKQPIKLLAWAIVLGLIFGLINFGEIPENWLRVARNRINNHAVSGDIVLVAIDEKSVRDIGRWPWPRSVYAKLIRKIDSGHPQVQMHDIIFSDRTDDANDHSLVRAAADSSNIYFPLVNQVGAQDGRKQQALILPELAQNAKVGSIAVFYNYTNEVWSLSRNDRIGGKTIPSYAAVLAGKSNTFTSGDFRIDYSLDPESIVRVSASDVLQGRISPTTFQGKEVIVGLAAERLGDVFNLPGRGKYGGVYVHILGAATLKEGAPIDLGWLPSFMLAVAAVLISFTKWSRTQPAAMSIAAVIMLAVPIILERNLIFVDITPGLFVLAWFGAGLLWRWSKKRGLVNAMTGLPNLSALKRVRDQQDKPLIVARILNYAQIASTMPMDAERSLIEQVVKRFRVGSDATVIYQGEEGIFAWTIPAGMAIGHHVEALHSLFRTPAKVQGKQYDLSISFGVEIGSGRTMANRFGSALVAADEAAAEGLKWKYHDPERMRDVNWRLSLLSQLDEAIEKGEVWVAFQPQMDLRTGQIRGAEALARWTHPEKGPISPAEFVAAAEQSDRIENLTYFIMERAVAAAAELNRKYGPFDMAVNLSARMLSERSLPARVKAILEENGLKPERLTLELTETAALANNGSDIDSLVRLKSLGVRISIDDYGTGLSTLDYLKRVPADEIKIDQSFVKAMRDNRSDLVMVQSTITLAHSLDRTVVAEGVEDREVLDLLVSMNCEVAQGFLVGRPASLETLAKRLTSSRSRNVA